MQRIFLALKQARKIILVLALTLISLSSLFIATQPGYAATPNQKLIQQEKIDKQSQAANNDREQAYEEQVKASEDPDKVYEKNLKAYKTTNPDEGLVQKTVEGTKELVDKVTSK